MLELHDLIGLLWSEKVLAWPAPSVPIGEVNAFVRGNLDSIASEKIAQSLGLFLPVHDGIPSARGEQSSTERGGL